ncbi:hypothetical protein Trydic_g18832 [Trypoxylus dichotomus]
MDVKKVVVYICFVILASAKEDIYEKKYICAPQLRNTFTKHNCEYNHPRTTSRLAGRDESLTRACCDRRCSEYYLITTYCKNSTIHHMSNSTNSITKDKDLENQITQHQKKEAGDEKERVANNMLVKETPQEERTYRPAVIVLTNMSSNPPIPKLINIIDPQINRSR